MPVGELVTATVAALPAVNSALTLIERLSKLVKGNAGLEMQEAVVQLREALLSVKEENLVLKQDKLSLTEEISALKKSISHKSQLRFEYPNYYLISETGQKDGPFCKSCQDNQQKMVRLTVRQANSAWFCDVCNTYFSNEVDRDFQHVSKVKNGWEFFDQ